MKFIGVDYGRKRIGLAQGDDEVRIAFPLDTIDGRNDVTRDARAVADRAAAEGGEAFIVGLPLNMDGSEGDQAALTRRFAAELERLSKRPVNFQDERLTTAEAHEALDAAEVRGRKRKGLADRLAARAILQSFLNQIDKQ